MSWWCGQDSQREAELEAGLEPKSPHYMFKPSAFLHWASLPQCAPSHWGQEPSSESRVTWFCCPNEGLGDLTPHASQTQVPAPLAGFPAISLSGQGQFRWKSKMPNPLNLYALGSYLAKFILVSAGIS